MTPTPQEVKDRVAVRHGYRDWFDYSERLDSELENEAMRDYAEACGKNRFHDLDHEIISLREKISELEKTIEKAGSELPNDEIIEKRFPTEDYRDTIYNGGAVHGANWMKEQAALVLLKERCKYAESIRQNDLLQELIQEKDKEIDELKQIIKYQNEQTYKQSKTKTP